MKTWVAIAGMGAGALALSVLVSAQSATGQIQQTTPVPGRSTPMAGGMAGQAPTGTGPAVKADCADNGWQNYPNQKFQSQQACERYVRTRASKKGAGARSMSSHTPGPGMTSPGSSQSRTTAPTPQPPR
jgi:hypothetical protein